MKDLLDYNTQNLTDDKKRKKLLKCLLVLLKIHF